MTKIDLLKYLTDTAESYRLVAGASIHRNSHMNEIKPDEKISQSHIDAILVDFINHIGAKVGIDYGLYTSDLRQ